MSEQIDNKQEKGISFSEDTAKGRYSNNMFVAHGPDEFIIDWILDSPSGAQLVARIIASPAHMKRVVKVLQQNVNIYEDKFGPIVEKTDTADYGFKN